MDSLARTVRNGTGMIWPRGQQQVMIVGPAKKRNPDDCSANDALVIGYAWKVLDALDVPENVELPAWVTTRLRAHSGDRYLLLLANTEYMGGSYLPLACYNGQTPITCAVPPDLRPRVDGFERCEPPNSLEC